MNSLKDHETNAYFDIYQTYSELYMIVVTLCHIFMQMPLKFRFKFQMVDMLWRLKQSVIYYINALTLMIDNLSFRESNHISNSCLSFTTENRIVQYITVNYIVDWYVQIKMPVSSKIFNLIMNFRAS